VREVVVERLANWLETMEQGVPAADPYEFSPDLVTRQRLGERERGAGKQLALGVIEEEEVKVAGAGIGNFQAQLRVTIEWFSAYLAGADDDPSEVNNRILANLQRRVLENRTLEVVVGDGSGVATVLRETGNSMDIDDYADRQIGGALFLLVQYKHDELDPRRRIPGADFLDDPNP